MKKLENFFKLAAFGITLSMPACASTPAPMQQCLQNCKEIIIRSLIENDPNLSAPIPTNLEDDVIDDV